MPVRVPRRGLVVPAGLWVLFLLQTAVIARWPGFVVDRAVDDLIASLQPRLPGLRGAAGVVARLGAREVLIPIGAVAGLVLAWRRRSLLPPVLLGASYLLVAAATGLVKAGLARPQPLPLPGVPGRAFPSGHAAQAVVVLGALALLAAAGRSPQWRRRALVVVSAVVTLGSVALLWRRAHWLTDMVAGVTVGLACLTTVVAALRAEETERMPVASPS